MLNNTIYIMQNKYTCSVIAAKAGIHFKLNQAPKIKLDSRFCGIDE